MAEDEKRADRILEGAPVGVIIEAKSDPSVFFGFCCGQGHPTSDPEKVDEHFSSCPIFLADLEWTEGMKRLFEPAKDPVSAFMDQTAATPGLDIGEEKVTMEDLISAGLVKS